MHVVHRVLSQGVDFALGNAQFKRVSPRPFYGKKGREREAKVYGLLDMCDYLP
jgi:hypothetical protein